MAITVHCPHCQGQFNVRDDFAGRKGRCPQCGGVVQAPTSAPASEPQYAQSARPAPRAPVQQAPSIPTSPDMGGGTGFPVQVGEESSVSMRAGGGRRSSRGGSRKTPVWPIVAVGAAVPIIILLVAIVVLLVRDNGGAEVADKDDKPAQEASGEPETVASTDFGGVREANSFEGITEAAVKILIRYPSIDPRAESFGAGFIIDRRGWVATNYHVIEHAHEDAVAVMESGKEFRIEGLIAADPTHDIAILQLKDVPYTMTIADISYNGEPGQLDEVYAYGHPLGEDFSATDGTVSRVAMTSQLSDDSRQFLYDEMNAPDDLLWIQHNVTISPGNSGGPLLDEDFRIIGINTWTNQATRLSYASHIRYLREMKFRATGDVTPLPSEREMSRDLIREMGGQLQDEHGGFVIPRNRN